MDFSVSSFRTRTLAQRCRRRNCISRAGTFHSPSWLLSWASARLLCLFCYVQLLRQVFNFLKYGCRNLLKLYNVPGHRYFSAKLFEAYNAYLQSLILCTVKLRHQLFVYGATAARAAPRLWILSRLRIPLQGFRQPSGRH